MQPNRKRNKQRWALPTIVLLLFALSVTAQKRATNPEVLREINLIERYASQTERLVNNKQRPFRIFADVSSAMEDGPSKWLEFKTEKEREDAATGENLNEQADVWLSNDNVVCVRMTITSPSGDWAHFITYYFRQDGSLAKLDAQLNTFYGDVTIKRSRFYAANGKLLKSTTRYFDLQTQKPKRAPGEFMDHQIPIFARVDRLPFFKLL